MAAAVHQQPRLLRRDYRCTDIHSGHRSTRSLPDATLNRHHDRWAVIGLGQPAGDDADNARMPAVAIHKHQRPRVAAPLDQRQRVPMHLRLDRFAVAVVPVQLRRQRVGLHRVVRGEQPRPEVRTPDPAARVYARSQ